MKTPRRLDILFDYFIAKMQYENYYNDIDYDKSEDIKKDIERLRDDPKIHDVDVEIFNEMIEYHDLGKSILESKNYPKSNNPNIENIQITAIQLDRSDNHLHFNCIYLNFDKMEVVFKSELKSKYYDYMAALFRKSEKEPLPF